MTDKTPWANLVAGERVRGRGRLVWTIARLHRADGYATIRLERRDTEGVELEDPKELTRPETEGVDVVPLADDLSDATNILRVHTAPDGEFDTFPGASAYGVSSMLSHLKIVHGLDVSKAQADPFSRHIAAHSADGSSLDGRPHRHDPAKRAAS